MCVTGCKRLKKADRDHETKPSYSFFKQMFPSEYGKTKENKGQGRIWRVGGNLYPERSHVSRRGRGTPDSSGVKQQMRWEKMEERSSFWDVSLFCFL